MTGPSTLPFDRPLGTHPRLEGGFSARVWAPRATSVAVVLVDADDRAAGSAETVVIDAEDVGHGVFTVDLPDARHGQRYLLRLDGTDRPDPWSRSQPEGTTGPSAFVDPAAIGAVAPGTDGRPARPDLPSPDTDDRTRTVIYELHVGCFSASGDFVGVVEHLDDLVDLGITHVELMPVNEFPGDRGWGYDGIFWSAAHHAYGGPGALVDLIDAVHQAGLGVILDVVYNHIGPTGDHVYDAHGPFFTGRHRTPWGSAINVDGPGSGAVRETILQNAAWWVGEVGVDGLRVDACHAIVDQSAHHVLAELTDRVRTVHPAALLIAESGLNDPRTVERVSAGAWGFGADWADDFHHALRTLLTDDREGWYADFGTVDQLAKALDRPYVHDGTWSAYRNQRFGAPPTGIDRSRFVVFDQNHDQIGNRPLGDRLPVHVRALGALCTLVSSSTPMLFMGQEYGEDAPFQFFSDHRDDFIADATRNGRRAEFADFTAVTGAEVPDPQAADTFERSKLTRTPDPALADLYRRLIALRPRIPLVDPVAAFDPNGRWLRIDRGDLVLVANFSDRPITVDCPPGDVDIATHPDVTSSVPAKDPHLTLPAWSGALIWREPTP